MVNAIGSFYDNYTAAGRPEDLTGHAADRRAGAADTQAEHSAQTDEAAAKKPAVIRNPGESAKKQAGRKSSPAECETCKNRKYQDGSDENVSFKSAAHIDPNAAAARVRSHEQEHVSNAYKKAAQNNGEVVSCNVAIHTAVCPECGRTYVSGGTTSTQIRYFNEDNPYQKDMKASDAAGKYRGMNIDAAF